jgi:bifunctional UDP-N-acetylglucosamine pyrophosphorylase/glucosamine-1-phosphate N-acetyltransferase
VKIILLAAGKSTRFKSSKHKALHDLLGKTVLERVLTTMHALQSKQIQLVLGHQLPLIAANLTHGETYIEQKEQLGTGHALLTGISNFDNDKENSIEGILVSCIDTPLLRSKTLESLIQHTLLHKAQIGVLTASLNQPFGYGRVKRDGNEIIAIIEEKDASEEEKQIKEINAGVYFFNMNLNALKQGLNSLQTNNKQGEYYLTDIIEWAQKEKLSTIAYQCQDPDEILGINTKADFSECQKILSMRKVKELQTKGVLFLHPESQIVSPETTIGQDTVIMPNCILSGSCRLGEGNQIGPNVYLKNVIVGNSSSIGLNSYIEDSTIGSDSSIKYSHIVQVEIGSSCSVGPFANLRPGTKLEDNSSVGDFVEIKNSLISSNAKVPHLSYIGDAFLGEDVNIGAGTITANFNAITGEKGQTKIGNEVKVGSNSVLVAPLEIADGCMVAAGSVVTDNVKDENSLIISRNQQTVKKGWVKEKRNPQ